MYNKKNTKIKDINKKQLISITSITVLIGIVIAMFFSSQQSKDNINANNNILNSINDETTNNEIETIETNDNVENSLENNDIITSDTSLTTYYEEINTNDIDDFSFFTSTTNENTNGGNYKVITTYNDYIDFITTNNIDKTQEQLSTINENYFKNHVVISVIDSFEKTYKHRTFMTFTVKENNVYINYEKTNMEKNVTNTGYWTYMIGVDYNILGKTEIEKLPINIQIL